MVVHEDRSWQWQELWMVTTFRLVIHGTTELVDSLAMRVPWHACDLAGNTFDVVNLGNGGVTPPSKGDSY